MSETKETVEQKKIQELSALIALQTIRIQRLEFALSCQVKLQELAKLEKQAENKYNELLAKNSKEENE